MKNPQKQRNLDDLDKEIISALQEDARQSYLGLSNRIGISEGTIRNRVRQLLRRGVFKLKAVVNPSELGFGFSCLVGFEVAITKLTEVESILGTSPNVYFLAACTGNFDLVAILIFRDVNEFDKFVREEISQLPGLVRIQTFVNVRVVTKPWTSNLDIAKLLEF